MIWAAWRAMHLQAAEMRQHGMTLIVSAVTPATFLVITLLARPDPTDAFVSRAVGGSMMMGLWSTTLWSSGSLLRREIRAGTLVPILTRPMPFWVVLYGKTCAVSAVGLLGAGVSVLLAAVALGSRPPLPGLAPCAVMAVLAVASAASLGVLVSAGVVLAHGSTRVIEALGYPVYLLGGLLLPVDQLPVLLRLPSSLLSLRYLVDLLESSPSGAIPAGPALASLLLTITYFLLGTRVLDAVLRRGRVDGSLEFA